MAAKIDTVTARSKLKVSREPYWQRINKGFYIGYRKMSQTSTGTWLVRFIGENGHKTVRTLGALEEYAQHARFDVAVASAREWLSENTAGVAAAPRSTLTVMDACDAYVERVRELKGSKSADDLKARYHRWVRPDPIHNVRLVTLTREHLNEFRRRLVSAPVKVNKAGYERERSKDTVNRDIAALRAALNRALEDRLVTTDFAWRTPLKPYKNVSKRRNLYLDREQRRALISHAPADDIANFLRGMSVLPLRPGALAALTVLDFDWRLHALKIGTDKSGQHRTIMLPEATAQLLMQAAANRPPAAALFAREDGHAWNKDSWKGPVKDAARRAGLPIQTTAYTLRHSVITDLVHGGLDLLTVAQLSGTSVAMIEKHYGHLRNQIAEEALAKLAL